MFTIVYRYFSCRLKVLVVGNKNIYEIGRDENGSVQYPMS